MRLHNRQVDASFLDAASLAGIDLLRLLYESGAVSAAVYAAARPLVAPAAAGAPASIDTEADTESDESDESDDGDRGEACPSPQAAAARRRGGRATISSLEEELKQARERPVARGPLRW